MKLKKWNVLIYALLIINLALILVYIVSSRTNSFLFSVLNERASNILNINIRKKADVAFKYNFLYNMNGTWFTNTRLCPSNIVFSWTTLSWVVLTITGTSLYFDSNNNPYCSWSNNDWKVNIFYQDNYLSFSWIVFSWSSLTSLSNDWLITVVWWLTYTGNLFTCTINDSQNSRVSFSGNIWPTFIDSNFNSDNYKCNSTWNYDYPDFLCDDDIFARKNNIWYIESTGWYFNIFWNNSRIENFIASNTNNINTGVSLLWNTSTWLLFLNISDWAYLKLIQFNKDTYDSTSELKKTWEFNWILSTTLSWFISFSWTWLTLNQNLSNWIVFDFVNNYYGIFLSYSGWTYGSNLQYILSWIDENNYPIILNPLDDSDPNYLKFLGYDIIISDEKQYFSKIWQIDVPKNVNILKNNFVN